MVAMTPNPADSIMECIDQLAKISESPNWLTRKYLTEQHKLANEQVKSWMQGAGMIVHQDAAGNIVGRYEGQTKQLPALMIGSHLDSVVMAGKYDGPLGVLSGIAVVQALYDQGVRLPIAIEVIGFADEEGARFQSTYLGSRAVAGNFDETLLSTLDESGISLRDALMSFGLPPNEIINAARSNRDIFAYIELHIEQGPILEKKNLPVGAVTAISGAQRLKISVNGQAGHAGTVPMKLRVDALVAASECVIGVEKIAMEISGVVGTVGQLITSPGAPNVIPGNVEFTVDLRAEKDCDRDLAFLRIKQKFKFIANKRGVEIIFTVTHVAKSIDCDPRLIEVIGSAISELGWSVENLPSGAGHDAAAMASLVPVGMVFLRCKDGISHSPEESISNEDASIGIEVLSEVVRKIADDYSRYNFG